MVGNRQPAAFRRKEAELKNANEYGSIILSSKQKRNPRPGPVHCSRQQGMDVRKTSSPSGSGEVFFLDIPFYRTRRDLECPA
jgi:hypothetical protein